MVIGNLDYFLENLEKFQLETLVNNNLYIYIFLLLYIFNFCCFKIFIVFKKKLPTELIPVTFEYPFEALKFLEKVMTVLASCASIALGIYFYKFAKSAMNMGKKGNDIFGIGL